MRKDGAPLQNSTAVSDARTLAAANRVVVASNLMAMLIQCLSAKLGIATGRNLAELCRDHFSRPVVLGMWVLMELVAIAIAIAIATDLAEFIGAAVGFNLLFGLPLWLAGQLTAVITFLILGAAVAWLPSDGGGHLGPARRY